MRGRSALLAAALLAVLPAGAIASARVTKQDRVATRLYLEAKLAYEQARLASASASKSAVEALAEQIGRECPGVATDAPKAESSTTLVGSTSASSPRRRGELNRQMRQSEDMEIELYTAVDQALVGPYRKAELSFVHMAMSLRWSDTGVTRFMHFLTLTSDGGLAAVPLQVCADLRYWAKSGYTALPAAARTLARQRATTEDAFLRFIFLHPRSFRHSSFSHPLVNFEDARDRALVRKTQRIAAKVDTAVGSSAIASQLQRTLGLAREENAEEHEQPPKAPEQPPKAPLEPPKRSMVIGHGRTLAGGRYTIEVEHRHHLVELGRGRCVEIEISETIGGPRGRSSGTLKCLSRSLREAPKVTCEEGLLTIEAQTLPSARYVRLTLSNGRQIVSRVAIVPPRLGGPIGYYHQAVWGPAPIPVTLSELGAHGRLLRSVNLPSREGCKRAPLEEIRIVATGTVPRSGLRFIIIANRLPARARELRRPVHVLAYHIAVYVLIADLGALRDMVEAKPRVIKSHSRRRPPPFALQVATGCRPHEYAIVYGLLNDPRDRVFARMAGGLVPLRRVPMPASMHTTDALAYAALPAVPGEVVVRSPAGRTLMRANLSSRAKHARELCEGEAEPPA